MALGKEPVAELGELLVFLGVIGDFLERWLNHSREFFNDLAFWNSKIGQFNVIRNDGVEDGT